MAGKTETAATCSAKYCKGCDHWRGGSGVMCCEYLLDVGHRRPCPPGEGCTEHTKHKGGESRRYVNPMAPNIKQGRKPGHQPGTPAPNRKIEPEKARELFDAGKTDAEIAAAFGASEATVRGWRTEQGLTRKEKGKPGRPPKKRPDCLDKIINEEDETVENNEVKAAQEDDGMTVEQLAALFANMGKAGQADRVTVGGAPVHGVVVTLRYDAKSGDGPAGMTVELKV